MTTPDSARHYVFDMSRHEHNIFAILATAIAGGLVPNATVDVLGKIGLAFVCGFVSLAGQALWRRFVRAWHDARASRRKGISP